MSGDESEYDGSETDWLANCYQSYGFGHTKEQALLAAASHGDPTDEPVTVSLVEHVGEASVRMSGFRVEEFVQGETVEIDPEAWEELREVAIDATVTVESTLEHADRTEEYVEDDDGMLQKVEAE